MARMITMPPLPAATAWPSARRHGRTGRRACAATSGGPVPRSPGCAMTTWRATPSRSRLPRRLVQVPCPAPRSGYAGDSRRLPRPGRLQVSEPGADLNERAPAPGAADGQDTAGPVTGAAPDPGAHLREGSPAPGAADGQDTAATVVLDAAAGDEQGIRAGPEAGGQDVALPGFSAPLSGAFPFGGAGGETIRSRSATLICTR